MSIVTRLSNLWQKVLKHFQKHIHSTVEGKIDKWKISLNVFRCILMCMYFILQHLKFVAFSAIIDYKISRVLLCHVSVNVISQ